MNTILYIGDRYISTLAELRECVLGAFADGNKHSLIREVETLYHDGLLQRWLEAGNSEEQALAAELHGISPDIDSSKLRERIVLILTDEMFHVSRNIGDYLKIEKSELYADGDNLLAELDGERCSCEMPLKCGTLMVRVQCKVLKAEAETFRFSLLYDGADTGVKHSIDLRDCSEGQMLDMEFPVSGIDNIDEFSLELVADKQQLFAVDVRRKGVEGFKVNDYLWVEKVLVQTGNGPTREYTNPKIKISQTLTANTTISIGICFRLVSKPIFDVLQIEMKENFESERDGIKINSRSEYLGLYKKGQTFEKYFQVNTSSLIKSYFTVGIYADAKWIVSVTGIKY